jgi:hypothetical protein
MLVSNDMFYHRYSVNAQIVCDMYGVIIAVHAGCPGSSADSTVFQRMDHFQEPEEFFSPGEYLLADAAYAVSTYCVPPYKAPATDHEDNEKFNFYLACSRARNEHCIGVLKGRWQSLRELRHRLQDDSSMENLCSWTLSCCVLHNIMVHIRDYWMKTAALTNYQPPEVYDQQVSGITFRDTLKKTTLETNRLRNLTR